MQVGKFELAEPLQTENFRDSWDILREVNQIFTIYFGKKLMFSMLIVELYCRFIALFIILMTETKGYAQRHTYYDILHRKCLCESVLFSVIFFHIESERTVFF
jgi:ABC-type long-subunit fatty acid transport system fused permease/ATPase subunit